VGLEWAPGTVDRVLDGAPVVPERSGWELVERGHSGYEFVVDLTGHGRPAAAFDPAAEIERIARLRLPLEQRLAMVRAVVDLVEEGQKAEIEQLDVAEDGVEHAG